LRQAWAGVLQQGLRFAEPAALVATNGATWDYDGGDYVCEQLREPLRMLVEKKGQDDSKENHPLFLLFAGPGQGKSRLVSEFGRLALECTDGKLPGGRVFPFLMGLENGVAPRHWEIDEHKAERFVASRMLWQLKDANAEVFAQVGIPTMSFAEFQKSVPSTISSEEVFRAVQTGEGICGQWTALIGIDGMQKLDGFEERSEKTGKQKPFYRIMAHVSSLVNHKEGPLVIGLMAATESLQTALADSPQRRVNLTLPVVTNVTRLGKPVFDTRDDPLLGLLLQDMGGHGRAVEALEAATQNLPGASHAQLLQSVVVALGSRYQGAVTTLGFAKLEPALRNTVVEDMLAAALSGKVFSVGHKIQGLVDPTSLALVRVEYVSTECTQYRLVLPYVWLHLFLSQQSVPDELKAWRSTDYADFAKHLSTSGEAWEEFNANFRSLRALAFPDGHTVKVEDLHRGAVIEPGSLRSASIINQRLKFERAKSRVATNSSACGMAKRLCKGLPKEFDGLPRHTCPVKVFKGQPSRTVSLTTCRVLLLNADKAPAGDAVVMLKEKLASSEVRIISEVWQEKQGMSRVDPQEEWAKSCDDNDILVVACNDRKEPPELPDKRLIFVGREQFSDYYGMYVGRAFLNANRAKILHPPDVDDDGA
jgi:hypothetical protein